MSDRETLHELLNKVEAIIQCGASTIKDFAKDIGKPQSSCYEWITQRTHKPQGDVILEIRSWAARKTLAIAESMTPEHVRRCYRTAYRDVQQRRGK